RSRRAASQKTAAPLRSDSSADVPNRRPAGTTGLPGRPREGETVADGSAGLHEPEDRLQAATIDRHRALRSIMEELEAVDWYAQRVDATSDPTLAAVLAHNRDEEKEHAAMVIEWLRRNDAVFERHLRTYLFT